MKARLLQTCGQHHDNQMDLLHVQIRPLQTSSLPAPTSSASLLAPLADRPPPGWRTEGFQLWLLDPVHQGRRTAIDPPPLANEGFCPSGSSVLTRSLLGDLEGLSGSWTPDPVGVLWRSEVSKLRPLGHMWPNERVNSAGR